MWNSLDTRLQYHESWLVQQKQLNHFIAILKEYFIVICNSSEMFSNSANAAEQKIRVSQISALIRLFFHYRK